MAVITADAFKKMATTELEISGLAPGEKITVLVKNVSMVDIITSGQLPNSVLVAVKGLFTSAREKGADMDIEGESVENLEMLGQLLDNVCRKALIEPAFDEIKDFMTDTQRMEIFNFVQRGPEKILPFRHEQKDS